MFPSISRLLKNLWFKRKKGQDNPRTALPEKKVKSVEDPKEYNHLQPNFESLIQSQHADGFWSQKTEAFLKKFINGSSKNDTTVE